MADRQKTSQIIGQVEYEQSNDAQKTSQVIGQVEYEQSNSSQRTSFIIGQVEYSDEPFVPPESEVSFPLIIFF